MYVLSRARHHGVRYFDEAILEMTAIRVRCVVHMIVICAIYGVSCHLFKLANYVEDMFYLVILNWKCICKCINWKFLIFFNKTKQDAFSNNFLMAFLRGQIQSICVIHCHLQAASDSQAYQCMYVCIFIDCTRRYKMIQTKLI